MFRVRGSVLPGVLSVLFFLSHPVFAQNTRIESFAKAKKLAASAYEGHQTTFYCGCAYREKTVDFAGCGYVPKGNPDTARRLEWEHVVPAENFGRSFAEWRDGHPACVTKKGEAFKGRNCARKMSREFRRMEADLYNLMPESAETNRRRSNFGYGMVVGEAREYGACDIEIADKTCEPRPEIRGDIARIFLYMDQAYPGRGILSRQSRQLFSVWSREDPVDAWERERARRIEDLQGNANAFVR
ncbi:MAG: endonuclease I [Deltaproteobacteria bacterium]|nr:endonuclease I [Deltaproteobacteria bacterium]